ncbi:hypothetical protein [Mesorhizobium sp. RIZ17]|jgi:hypothetical protein|uniref:hypothetical protein n=1 Tax=Mesorhizobium sp. RIZ17 TaxID=3132743 RepID=UPI003DA8E65E
MAPSAVPTSSSVLTAIGVGAIKKLERLFLPAGPDHVRQFEDTAARADRVRRRIHHRLGVLFTGLTLAALPITLLYIVLSKQFISGITQGAVK